MIGLSCRSFFALALGFALFANTSAGGEENSAATEAAKKPQHLLVVAPEQFLPALDDFIEHKSKTSLEVHRHSLEAILRESSGTDDAEKLKRFLFNQWSELGLDFVLLVGDVDVLPVRYMTLDRLNKTAFNYAFYPTDLYYADLAKADESFETWNARQDDFHSGYFGEVRGEANKDDPINYDQIDYHPEIAVGRWPVSSIEEVELVAEKTMRYEQQVLAGESPHLQRAALVAVDGWIDSRRWMDRQADKLGDGWEIEKRYFAGRRRGERTPPPTREEVRNLFNRGMGFILHTGHGQTDQWEKCFFMPDLDRISNSDSLPIVVSAGCSTANFAPLPPYGAYVDTEGNEHKGTDHGEKFAAPPPPPGNYQPGKLNPTGLGEQLLIHSQDGAVAYIGCNTGSQPCGLTLVEGFIDAVSRDSEPRLGQCWSEAVSYYHDRQRLVSLKPSASWYPASIFFQPMKFMLFGDPSLRLPSSK